MASKQQIKDWEKEYGKDNVIRYSVDQDGKNYEMFIFRPKAHARPYSLYSRGMTLYRQDKLIELGTLVINECWLDGSKEFRDRESMLHISAAMALKNEMDFLLGDTSSTSTSQSEDTQA